MERKVKHFTDLETWRKAHDLFLHVLGDLNEWPTTASSRIVAEQLIRSLGSICANISEGFNRSRKRFANCLDIAAGEANEAENWLYKVRDAGFVPVDVAKQRLRAIIEVERMLGGLKRKILSNASAREDEPEHLLSDRSDPWSPADDYQLTTIN